MFFKLFTNRNNFNAKIYNYNCNNKIQSKKNGNTKLKYKIDIAIEI